VRRILLAALLLGGCRAAGAAPEPSAALSRLAGLPCITVERIGTSRQGRPLEVVTAANPDAIRRGAPAVLIVCGQHGDEPVAPQAALRVLGQLAAGRHGEILDRIVTVVVPYANPDGLAAGCRANAAGADLNRDWRERTQPETRAVAALLLRLRPMLLVDAHEWAPDDVHECNSVEVPLFDAGQPEPEWARPLGRWVSAALTACAERGVYVQRTHWRAANDPRLLHRFAARAWQTPSLLFETMAAGTAPDPARIAGASAFIGQILRAAAAAAPAPPPPPAPEPAPEPPLPVWPGNVALASGLLLLLALAQSRAPERDARRRRVVRRRRLKLCGRIRCDWRTPRPCRPAPRPAPVRARPGTARRYPASSPVSAVSPPRRRG